MIILNYYTRLFYYGKKNIIEQISQIIQHISLQKTKSDIIYLSKNGGVKNMKKFICILLLLMSMLTMLYFSSQDGPTSKSQADIAIKIIDEVREKVTLKDGRLKEINEKIMKELKNIKKLSL